MDEQYRTKILEDGTVLIQRLYCLEPGFSVWCPDKSCAFCKYCNDLFYDYTNGPYMFLCDEDRDGELDLTDVGCIGKCDRFAEDEGIDERNKEMEEISEKVKLLSEDEEFMEAFRKAMIEHLLKGVSDIHELGVEDGGEEETEKADGRDQ